MHIMFPTHLSQYIIAILGGIYTILSENKILI